MPAKGLDGFEFVEEPLIKSIGLAGYWETNIGSLLSQAANFELEKDYAKVLKIYSLAVRMSRKINNRMLISMLESKKEEIYKIISE